MKASILVLCTLAPFGLTGCSTPSLSDFEQQQIQLECEFAVKCCPTVGAGVHYTSVEACVSTNSMGNAAALAGVQQEIAEKKVVYDGASAAACLSDARSIKSSCTHTVSNDEEIKLAADCNGVLRGTTPVGASCTSDSSGTGTCSPSSYCDYGATNTCIPWQTSGQSCATTLCSPDLTCDFTTMVCSARKPNGAACDGEEQCTEGACTDSVCATQPPVAATTYCPMNAST